MLPFRYKLIAGSILFALILISSVKGEKRIGDSDLEIYVPDVHCRHCKLTLENSFNKLDGIEKVFVDVDKKTIEIKGNISKDRARQTIKQLGYHPE